MLAINRVSKLLLAVVSFSLAGCASLTDALFGERVPVDRDDATPPTVQILIADHHVKRPSPGDFVVTTTDDEACIEPSIWIVVSADDPEGVKYVELDDISVQSYCGATPGVYEAYPPRIVAGDRNGLPDSSSFAQTRITLIKQLHLAPDLNEMSRFCHPDRPYLGNAWIRVTARAGNFGGEIVQSGEASLRLLCSSLRLSRPGPRACDDPQPDGSCRP